MSESPPILEELPHAQRERLAYIDFSLQYFGEISRQDLINRFATGLAASTRDLALYRAMAPNNLSLSQQTKKYLRQSQFTTLFNHNPGVVLSSLSRGFGDGIASALQPSQQCFEAVNLIHPDAEVIAGLMRAIHLEQPIEAEYVSLSSGQKRRMLAPHAIVNNGHRWHVRAFDCDARQFRDFVCTRFLSVESLARPLANQEMRQQDTNWQQQVELELIAHPGVQYPKAIELDYAMQEGKRRVLIRAALAAYLLRYWQVDCSAGHRFTGQGCQLALANLAVLEGIENAHLAPGVMK